MFESNRITDNPNLHVIIRKKKKKKKKSTVHYFNNQSLKSYIVDF